MKANLGCESVDDIIGGSKVLMKKKKKNQGISVPVWIWIYPAVFNGRREEEW